MKKIIILLCAITTIASCEKENEQIKYALTISAEPSAGGTVLPNSMEYFEGDNVQLIAQPSTGYAFKDWSGASGGSTTRIIMDGAKTVVGNFVKVKYKLNITVTGQGTVSQELVKAGVADYTMASTVKLTANPTAGWIFEKWTGGETGTDNPKTITMGAAAKDITAVFILDKVLTTVASGSGTIAKQLVSGRTYTVTANASANWIFEKWSGGLSGTDNPTNITLNEDQTVIAIFKNNAPISRAADGKTLVAKAGTAPGTEFVIDGITYTVLDNATLAQWVTASAGGAFSGGGDLAGTPASEAKDLTKAVTTLCTDMKELFKDKTNFNGDISTWDVSNVTTMEGMFEGADKFNKDVSKWDTNKVQNMDKMFKNATEFKQDLSKWCVTNLTTEPTDFTEGSGCEDDKKPVWGTWPNQPFVGDWVLQSSSAIDLSTDTKIDDFSYFGKGKVACENYEMVQMSIYQSGDVGKYSRVLNICYDDGVTPMVTETEEGYWIYNGDENSIKVSDGLDFTQAEKFGLEYTDDYSYFYVTVPASMSSPSGADVDILVTEVYKKVK